MFLYFEGVNFGATLYDTNDISTVRGSSILLEDLAEAMCSACAALSPQVIERGASKAMLEVTGGAEQIAATAKAAATSGAYRHLCVVYGWGATEQAAHRMARIRQMQSWTVPAPDPESAERQDQLDQKRPGTVQDAGVKGLLSTSVNIRRRNGHKQRRLLFAADTRYAPPQSFEDLTASPPGGVPEVIHHKLALIYADGAGAGALRTAVGARAFSDQIEEYRGTLATAIQDWFEARGAFGRVPGKTPFVPRFDTLLWGGDDMTFILPAWLALPFIDFFFDQVRGWTFASAGGTQRLHHRLSCIIANQKTPIRQLMALATGADEVLKTGLGSGKGSGFTVDVFESSALPYDGVLAYRKALYGPRFEPGDDLFAETDAGRLIAFCNDALSHEDDDTSVLSVTQIHAALEALRVVDPNNPLPVASSGADNAVRDLITSYYKRVRSGSPDFDAMTAQFSERPRRMSMLLAQAAQLRPYAVAGKAVLA